MQQASIFKWDTIQEIATDPIQHGSGVVPGKMCEVELISGKIIRAWRSNDGREYCCHGLTFGGKESPAGILSPYTGQPVEMILREHYRLIPEDQARPGDILVWRGLPPETTPHSAILTDPVVPRGKHYLDDTTRRQTKNGLRPEANQTLKEIVEIYGESYNVYRRREGGGGS